MPTGDSPGVGDAQPVRRWDDDKLNEHLTLLHQKKRELQGRINVLQEARYHG